VGSALHSEDVLPGYVMTEVSDDDKENGRALFAL
jgi:hypothetical protein